MTLDITETLTLDADNPWPGLMSFSEATTGYFHGRGAEVAELYRLVKREPLTALFAQSGLGKTSLLNAGLFPRLRQEHFLPIYIRLDLAHATLSLSGQVKAALVDHLRINAIDALPPNDEETLWEYFHRDEVDFWGRRNEVVIPVLVFDQFEEIFTLSGGSRGSRDLRDAFLTELADLIEDRVPATVRLTLEADPDAIAGFDFKKANFKIIMSFREDYLPDFEGLRRTIPSIMSNRMRLVRMNGLQARDVILKPGGHMVEPDVADQIIRFVAGAGSQAELEHLDVEPALLSVVCRELNNKRKRLGRDTLTADLLGGAQSEIIGGFYRSSLADMDPRVSRFIEDRLLTSTGYRDSCALEYAVSNAGVGRAAIDTLIDRRLLRLEERLGTLRVELTHDLLTSVIKEERDRRRAEEAQARLNEEQRRRVARARMVAVSAMATVAVLLGVIAIVWTDKIAIKRERDTLFHERQMLLSTMTGTLTDVAERHRLTPGSAEIIETIAIEAEKLATEFAADLKKHGIKDPSSVERLMASNLMLRADCDILRGRFGDAMKRYVEARQLLDRLGLGDSEDLELRRLAAEATRRIGFINRLRGRLTDALAAFEDAQQRADDLVKLDPAQEKYKRLASLAMTGRADAERDSGDSEAAMPLYRKRLDNALAELKDKPGNIVWKREAANSHGRIGDLALRAKKYTEAEREFAFQLAILGELLASDPSNIRAKVSMAAARISHGTALLGLGWLPEARSQLNEAHDVYSFMVTADPKTYNWGSQMGNVNHRLAELAMAENNPGKAVVAYREAISHRQAIVKLDPGNGVFHNNLSLSLEGMAIAQERLGLYDDAVSSYRGAREHRILAGEVGDEASEVALDRVDERIRTLKRTGG